MVGLQGLVCIYFASVPQAQNLKVCSIDDDLGKRLKHLRFKKSKTNTALISELQITLCGALSRVCSED